MKRIVLSVLFLLAAAAVARAEPATAIVASGVDLASITLVRSVDGKAVVRADAALHVLAVGDRVGRTAAVVVEVTPGRLVLEEVTKASDGRPLRAQIVLRDGQTGGRRFQRNPDRTPPLAVRPYVSETKRPRIQR